MKNQTVKIALVLISLGLIAGTGCGKKKNPVAAPSATYEELVEAGWEAFSVGNYAKAHAEFSKAKKIKPDCGDACEGLGWTLLKMDSLTHAGEEFSLCQTINDASATCYAGWAFLLNIQQDFALSNEKIDQAVARDPNWVFIHWITLDVNDLRVMKAENYFLLGNFDESLNLVQLLNPTFRVDVSTTDGQSALAREIERLKLVG